MWCMFLTNMCMKKNTHARAAHTHTHRCVCVCVLCLQVATSEELADIVAHATQDVPCISGPTSVSSPPSLSPPPPAPPAPRAPSSGSGANATAPSSSGGSYQAQSSSSNGSGDRGAGSAAGAGCVWASITGAPRVEELGLEWLCYCLHTAVQQGRVLLGAHVRTPLDAATMQMHKRKQQPMPQQQQQQQQHTEVWSLPRLMFGELAVVAYKQRSKENGAGVTHAVAGVRAVERVHRQLMLDSALQHNEPPRAAGAGQPLPPIASPSQGLAAMYHQLQELVMLGWRARASAALQRACTQLLAQLEEARLQQSLKPLPLPPQAPSAAGAAAGPGSGQQNAPKSLSHAVLRSKSILQRVCGCACMCVDVPVCVCVCVCACVCLGRGCG